MTIIYNINNNSLLEGLSVINEIRCETGMTPTTVVLQSGEHVNFDHSDYRRLECGLITEDEYIKNHISLGYIK